MPDPTNGQPEQHRTERVQGVSQPPRQPPHVASTEALQWEFQRLAEQNRLGITELGLQGIQLDPMRLMHGRIDNLIESIAQFAGPDGPRWAMMARLRFEQEVAQNISAARAEGTKAQLSVGAHLTPAQIRDLARQTNTLGKKTGS